MEMKDRISAIIKDNGLSKTAFAKSLNLSQPFVSQLCAGVSMPSERTIRDICEKYNVNEFWLRTGEGEMCRVKTRKEEMTEFATKFVGGELSEFQTNLINVISKLDADQIALLANIADTMAKEWQKEKTGE